jgi:hypothetical protein
MAWGYGMTRAVLVLPLAAQQVADEAGHQAGLFRGGVGIPLMGDLKDAQPCPRGRDLAEDLLALEPADRREFPVIEDFRGVPAQRGVHPPRPVEQQPRVGGHRRVVAQDVFQRRNASPRRVGGLARLGELLGITHQDEVLRGTGHRQDAGQ